MATLGISPATGYVGATIEVGGSGLSKAKRYELAFNGVKVAEFTATSGGSIPKGVKFRVPETAAVGKKGELGTKFLVTLTAKRAKQVAAETAFELQASIKVDAVSAYLGQVVKATATGLLPNDTYQLVMLSSVYHAFPAGLLESNGKGSGTTTFVVPGYLGPAMYHVDLMHKRDGYPTMQVPTPLPVIGYSPDALIASPPKSGGPNSRPGVVQIPFRNTTTTLLMPVVYAIVYTDKDKPIQITSSAVSLPPESTSDALISFAHLPKGKYNITVFATTTSGHIVSKMFSFPFVA